MKTKIERIEIKSEHKGKSQELYVAGDLATLDTFIVVGPGFYGYGESVKTAKSNCIKSGAKKTDKMVAYLGDSTLGVDGMGYISALAMVKIGEV